MNTSLPSSSDRCATPCPLLHKVERHLSRMKPRKSPGFDGIPLKLWRAAAPAVISSGQLSTEWRGRRFEKRFKEGDPTQCANDRGLLVEGQNLQEHHEHSVPTRLCGCMKVPTPLQCGCMNLRCAARAPHTTRTFLLCCMQRRMLGAAIFVHFSTTFDKVIRQTIIGVTFDLNEAVLAKPSAPLSPTCLRLLNTFTPVEVCCVSFMCQIIRLYAALQTNTWFVLGGSSRTIRTSPRARQGYKFGALIFNLACGRALTQLTECLARDQMCFLWCSEASLWTIEQGSSADREITCVDDQVLFVTDTTCEELKSKLVRFFSASDLAFPEHNLSINWEPGETETLIAWRGPFSVSLNRETLNLGTSSSTQCVVANQYRHVCVSARPTHLVLPMSATTSTKPP